MTTPVPAAVAAALAMGELLSASRGEDVEDAGGGGAVGGAAGAGGAEGAERPQRPGPTPAPAPAPAPAKPKRLPKVEDFPSSGPNALGDLRLRVWARILDELLIQFPVSIVFGMVLMLQYGQASDVPEDSPAFLIYTVVVVVLQVAYETISVGLWGRTAGKWFLGMKVARYTDGKKPTWGQAMLRTLVPAAGAAAGWALAGVAVLGSAPVLATSFFDPLRRGWHDQAAGTIVIRTR